MPGILCSAYDPTDLTIEPKWRRGLELIQAMEMQFDCLFPPLDKEGTLARYRGILQNEIRPAHQRRAPSCLRRDSYVSCGAGLPRQTMHRHRVAD